VTRRRSPARARTTARAAAWFRASPRCWTAASRTYPAPLAERLRRTGYLKVDASGLFARDLYVEASQVAGVSEEGVRLSVGRDELIEEA